MTRSTRYNLSFMEWSIAWHISWSHFLNPNLNMYVYRCAIENFQQGFPERRWLSQLSSKGSSLTESGDRWDRSNWCNVGHIEVRVGLITFSLRTSPALIAKYQNFEELLLLLTKNSEEGTCWEQFEIIRVKVGEGGWLQFPPFAKISCSEAATAPV